MMAVSMTAMQERKPLVEMTAMQTSNAAVLMTAEQLERTLDPAELDLGHILWIPIPRWRPAAHLMRFRNPVAAYPVATVGTKGMQAT